MAIAAAAVIGFGRTSSAGPPTLFMAVTWSLTGLFLLLVGALDVLEIWIGQCAFAALAVLLWINAPYHTARTGPATAAHWRTGVGVVLAVLASVGQGAMFWLAPTAYLPVAGAMLLAFAVMTVASAGAAGPNVALRVGGWAATYGVLLTTGLLSLSKLVPTLVTVAGGGRVQVMTDVAAGFGNYAPEAAALLLLGPAALAVLRMRVWAGRLLGMAVILAVAVHIGWRLGSG
jgi:hypothetical protein